MTRLAIVTDTDAELERRIETTLLDMLNAPTRELRHARMREMYRLIGERSPEQIAKMEREMGLS